MRLYSSYGLLGDSEKHLHIIKLLTYQFSQIFLFFSFCLPHFLPVSLPRQISQMKSANNQTWGGGAEISEKLFFLKSKGSPPLKVNRRYLWMWTINTTQFLLFKIGPQYLTFDSSSPMTLRRSANTEVGIVTDSYIENTSVASSLLFGVDQLICLLDVLVFVSLLG